IGIENGSPGRNGAEGVPLAQVIEQELKRLMKGRPPLLRRRQWVFLEGGRLRIQVFDGRAGQSERGLGGRAFFVPVELGGKREALVIEAPEQFEGAEHRRRQGEGVNGRAEGSE